MMLVIATNLVFILECVLESNVVPMFLTPALGRGQSSVSRSVRYMPWK